jgi:hypothetical protein
MGAISKTDGAAYASVSGYRETGSRKEWVGNDTEKNEMTGLRTAALLFLIALGLSVVIWSVHGEENATVSINNGSIVVVETPQIDYNFTHFPASTTYRIAQGDNVYINDTIDVSGMGWGSGFAWYGKYGEFEQPQYIREFTNYRNDMMNFYIDPAIFLTRTGMWYQYYGNKTEKQGNLAAFKVLNTYRNLTVTFPNGTVVNQTEYIRNASAFKPLVIPQESILPEVHEADYLLAIGDPLILKSYGPAQVWIFGRVDQTFGVSNDDNMTFPSKDFLNFEPGAYTLIIQHSGNNTEFDVRSHNGTLQYQDGWNGVKTVDVSALQPGMVKQQVESLIGKTDDTYEEHTLQIQEPLITITRMDDVWLNSKMLEFHIDNTADVTFKDIRGYTNLQNGTNITVVLDKQYNGIGRPRSFTYAQTWKTNQGNRTMFQAYIPIIWDTIPLGIHTITASGPFGSYVDANFPVEVMPADSFRPNATLKYTGDANPWKPNLTIPAPIVVTKVVTQVVTVEVTPSDAQVQEQQKVAWDKKVKEIFDMVVYYGAIVIVGFTVLRFIYRAWQRRKWHKK